MNLIRVARRGYPRRAAPIPVKTFELSSRTGHARTLTRAAVLREDGSAPCFLRFEESSVVKDLAARSDKESQVEVGRGVIDFPALFRTLISIGYQGQVGLEYEINAKAPLPGMIESMAYMRGVLAAVKASVPY